MKQPTEKKHSVLYPKGHRFESLHGCSDLVPLTPTFPREESSIFPSRRVSPPTSLEGLMNFSVSGK